MVLFCSWAQPHIATMTIVRSTYRYKRPPKKRKPVALEVPVIVRASDPKKSRRQIRSGDGQGKGRAQPFRLIALPSALLRGERRHD